jgi:beta-glucosidase
MASRRTLLSRTAAALAVGALALTVVPAQGAARKEPPGARCGSFAWCDVHLSADRRAALLLAAMTQDEKISLLGGDDPFSGQGPSNPHTGTSNGIPRLGVPTVYYSDGPQGPRQGASIGLPSPMALAATFDTAAAARYATVVAKEVKAKGNDVVYGPTVNVLRTPLGGRTFEAYGEDPYLDARTTVAWIKAVQAQGVLGDVKHFAANNQEGDAGPAGNIYPQQLPIGAPLLGNRMTEDSVIDDRTLHEVYLLQFEAAVKEARVATIMCSYNRLNTRYACQNAHLLQDVLRKQWGFQGVVLADYGAAKDPVDSLNHGLDFEPWPGLTYDPREVSLALASGLVSQATLDAHVLRILRTMFAYGLFDRPAYRNDDAQIDKRADAAVSEAVSASSITLLRNGKGLLPLSSKVRRIAVIGRPATLFVTGGGSGNITPYRTVTLLDALKKRVGKGVTVTYDDGTDLASAVANAAQADVAVVAASQYQSEGSDNYCLTLECPSTYGDQDTLITTIAAAQPKTAVVLETGGPVLTPWRDRVGALLEAWYPGADGGTAIAKVLYGDVDPGGRLPATFPDSEAQLPTAGDPRKYPGVAERVQYLEGLHVGYRWYDKQGLTPAFPFGYGLSYTTFRYGPLRARPSGADVVVTMTVTDTGSRAGTAVPQLYLTMPTEGEPVRQLRGYAKVSLRPGQSTTVSFRLRPRDLAWWSTPSQAWRVSPGCFGLSAGASSRSLPSTGVVGVGVRCAGALADVPLPARVD